nr:hypothetical protein BN444_01160 [Xanthomonas translucens pv. translucens DSM 18974]
MHNLGIALAAKDGICQPSRRAVCCRRYSTVTDLARLRGLSRSVPRASAVW